MTATLPFFATGLAGVAAGAVGIRRRLWASVTARDLLGPAGGPNAVATALDDAGVIVGSASGRGFRFVGGEHAWLTPLGTGSRATGIGADGTIVGCQFSANDDAAPVAWVPNGDTRPLDLPGPGWIGAATAVAGERIVGWCAPAGGGRQPWLWPAGDGEALPIEAGRRGQALAVNGDGRIVGAVTGDGPPEAIVWESDGRTTRVNDPSGGGAEARGVNNMGAVVGSTITPSGGRQARLWPDPDAYPIDLPTLGGASAVATDLNDDGVIVGWSLADSGFARACAWVLGNRADSHRVVDLGTLGGQMSEATAINASGTIVGSASRGEGALNLPLRPGGWSWEDHAFAAELR